MPGSTPTFMLSLGLLLPMAVTAGQVSEDCSQFGATVEATGPVSAMDELREARRIPLSLAFVPGESELGAEASRALAHLLDCAEVIGLDGEGLLVIGFATPSESHGLPLNVLAHDRADAVARRLRKAGIIPQALRGAQTDQAAQSAHVELWLRD